MSCIRYQVNYKNEKIGEKIENAMKGKIASSGLECGSLGY